MGKNVQILPAILAEEPAELEKLVRQAEAFTDYAQFDIMDGKFVPSNSVSCEAIARLKPKLHWEAHLMVLRPEDCIKDFKRAGAEKIVFHYEATPSPEKTIEAIREFGMQAGLAINPETSLKAITGLVGQVDSVLFLSVKPGFYGSEFIPKVLNKIIAFRKVYPNMEIGIDGGIKESNIKEIARTGVDVICVGSAIFRQPDPASSYNRLKDLAVSAVS